MVEDEAEVYRCIEYLKERGISASHNYPGTGWNGVSLPIYPLLTDEEIEYIIGAVKEYEQSR
jgi:dTDP-4-amino-4,6-dideoxygalactose transaminase